MFDDPKMDRHEPDEPEVYTAMPFLSEEQREHINTFRIPVDSNYPLPYWIASLSGESAMPTDAELRMIWSYIEYAVKRTYGEDWQAKTMARYLPLCSGHVTKVLRKGARWTHWPDPSEGWAYRKNDSRYMPGLKERLPLVEVLDLINTYSWDEAKPLAPDWVKWKAEHPDVFPV
jgi:hypothetical protein